jgi:hypothetical protein
LQINLARLTISRKRRCAVEDIVIPALRAISHTERLPENQRRISSPGKLRNGVVEVNVRKARSL